MEPSEPEQIRTLARQLADTDGPVTVLGGEHDRNARVGDHLVKIHRAGADRETLRMHDAVLRHLARSPAAGLVPRLVASSLDLPDWSGPPVRILTWLPGPLWREEAHPSAGLLHAVGRAVARVDAALADFHHPAQDRSTDWNLVHAPAMLQRLGVLTDPDRCALAERVLRHHTEHVADRLTALPVQVIHNDANDYNVVLDGRGGVRGLIDFGDLTAAPRVCGLAIACAYASFRESDPVRGVAPVVAGYHAVSPLADDELTLLLDLMRTRLATSIVMAAWQSRDQPDNTHLLTSHDDAYRVLRQIEQVDQAVAGRWFRDACGLASVPAGGGI